MNLNDVKIAGNLVQEPELHHTPQGTPVTNVSLGVNETYTLNNEKRTATTFVDVQLWGAAAENFAKLVQKGQQILVEGALRQDTWEDKSTKQNRSKLFVKAERWQFIQYKSLSTRREEARAQEQGPER
jgi:single-strand DNA-binding protein